MQNLNEFRNLLTEPKKCVIVMHPRPDADALGSSLGLAGYLKKKGHSTTVISPTEYPEFLKWMKGNEEVVVYSDGQESLINQAVSKADLIFCLDFSTLARIDGLGVEISKAEGIKVLIDHHLEPEDFADYEFWSVDAAATAELVFDLIKDLGDVSLIDQSIAENLYAGIMTDTGSFRHPSTTAKVFDTSANLVRLGADVNKVSRMIYDANTLSRLQLIGYALSERLKVLPEYKTAYFALSLDDLRKYDYKTGDSEGLVNYALSIKGVVMAVTIIESEDGVKMSFRSEGDFSVNELARKYFNGGGHKNAAGGRTGDSFSETVKKFESLLSDYKTQLNRK